MASMTYRFDASRALIFEPDDILQGFACSDTS